MSEEIVQGNIFQRFSKFLRECREELSKVSHPTKQETIQATMVTITIMVFVSVLLFVADLIFDRLMRVMISI